MGYHFTIREMCLCDCVKVGEKVCVSLKIENVGVAPIYKALPLYIRLKKEENVITFKTDVDIRKWLPGEHMVTVDFIAPALGEYELQIGIGGGDVPNVCFATDAAQDGNFAILTKMYINE